MYSILVVDDERIARETIKEYCNVYAEDFLIEQEFADGLPAIEYLKTHDVDAVFTDVKMPGATGIEVAKWICENKPYIKVIMVSGYSEFEYAKEAIQYKVMYYLLKVVDIAEFRRVIDMLRIELDKREPDDSGLSVKMFFYNLLCRMFSDEEEMRSSFFECTQREPENTKCRILSMQFNDLHGFLKDRWHYDKDMFKSALVTLMKVIHLQDFAMITQEEEDKYKFIVLYDKKGNNVTSEEIEYEILNTIGITVKIHSSEEMTVLDLYRIDSEKLGSDERDKLINSKKADNETNIKKQYVDEVKKYIDVNYQRELLKKDIADRFNMNSIYLGRQFKEVTGKNITEYIQEVRINAAKELLKTDMSLSDVCFSVGYIDMRNFKRLFRKVTGMTISEYRNSIKES